MQSVTVTIGRNVGTTPMPDSTWLSFQNAVVYALRETYGWGSHIEQHHGSGVWEGEIEDSFKACALIEHHNERQDVTLRQRLGALAADYRQDAIALSFGASRLIPARTDLSDPVKVTPGLGNGSARLGRLLTPGVK